MGHDTEEHRCPAVRATIAGGTITLNCWNPGLIRMGPSRSHLDDMAERGVTIADLTFLESDDGEEAIAAFVPAEAANAPAEDALIRWAGTVGYWRLWLPDRVVELEPDSSLAPAAVTCPTCGVVWRDSGAEFWSCVRSAGWFPGVCTACGGSLPEWAPEPAPEPEPARAPHPAHEHAASSP